MLSLAIVAKTGFAEGVLAQNEIYVGPIYCNLLAGSGIFAKSKKCNNWVLLGVIAHLVDPTKLVAGLKVSLYRGTLRRYPVVQI